MAVTVDRPVPWARVSMLTLRSRSSSTRSRSDWAFIRTKNMPSLVTASAVVCCCDIWTRSIESTIASVSTRSGSARSMILGVDTLIRIAIPPSPPLSVAAAASLGAAAADEATGAGSSVASSSPSSGLDAANAPLTNDERRKRGSREKMIVGESTVRLATLEPSTPPLAAYERMICCSACLLAGMISR